MNVSLTPQLEEYIKSKVQSGRYQSSSEVVREALRLMEERERRYEDLRREVAIGIEQANRGEVSPLDMEDIKEQGRRLLAERQPKVS